MRDNPIHVAVLGSKPERRVRKLEGMFRALLQTMGEPPLVARDGEAIVGVCGLARAGTCIPSRAATARFAPVMIGLGPRAMVRAARWRDAWAARDPAEPHWHLGPIAVDAHLQHQGIGSRLMQEFCAVVAGRHAMAYLETDKPENVVFYRRFGFEVAGEAEVVGTPNWFMRRP